MRKRFGITSAIVGNVRLPRPGADNGPGGVGAARLPEGWLLGGQGCDPRRPRRGQVQIHSPAGLGQQGAHDGSQGDLRQRPARRHPCARGDSCRRPDAALDLRAIPAIKQIAIRSTAIARRPTSRARPPVGVEAPRPYATACLRHARGGESGRAVAVSRSIDSACYIHPTSSRSTRRSPECREQRTEAHLHGRAVAGVERAHALALQQPGEQGEVAAVARYDDADGGELRRRTGAEDADAGEDAGEEEQRLDVGQRRQDALQERLLRRRVAGSGIQRFRLARLAPRQAPPAAAARRPRSGRRRRARRCRAARRAPRPAAGRAPAAWRAHRTQWRAGCPPAPPRRRASRP